MDGIAPFAIGTTRKATSFAGEGVTTPEERKVIRARFQANADDYRPVKFPPAHPYWCTGYAGDESHSIVVAYADNEDQILEYWPEAAEIDVEETTEYFFSDRFPKPEWFTDYDDQNPQ